MKNSLNYKSDSLKLVDAVSMGTGVMIGAGILAITGQIAESYICQRSNGI